MHAFPPVSLHFRSLLHSPLALCHLHPLLARLVIAGDVQNLVALRRVVELISHYPDHPSSFLVSRPLSRLYFNIFPSSSTFLFNLLIRAFSSSRRYPGESFFTFSTLLHSDSLPDRFTFPFLAKASSKLSSPAGGTQVHSQVLKRGLESDVYVTNTLLNMYSGFGEMVSAQKLFDLSFQILDVVSWNTIIDGYVKGGDLEAARVLFDQMPVRNEVSWSSMINGYAGNGELDVARSLFDKMPVGRDVVTWNSMISGFARKGLLPLARKLFDEMPARNIVSWNSIVSGYALNCEMDAAIELFNQMPKRNVVSWSCMISGYAQSNQFAEALQLFKEMLKEKNVKPNEITMVSVLSACAHLAAFDQGKWVHAYIDKNQMILDDDHNLGAALIDMYAKCGSMEIAMDLFDSLNRKNVSSWNALITGLAINGNSKESLEAFEKMRVSEVKPNSVTFVAVLMACTHGGLVREGRSYFESMSRDYGIEPELMHYGCMVDLLGRVGMLGEAEDIIRKMPMKPDIMILGALLGAARVHKDVIVADRIRNEVLELKDRQSGCHILFSNIYASVGRWDDASKARRLLSESGIKKEPGSSSVELDGSVYEFIAGNCSNPEANLMYDWLDNIGKKLRAEGYLPVTEDVLLDVDEEDKETWLTMHSEKLALAFALLKAPPNSLIRIVKNLRICGDCHSFIKYVSKVCSREILVRDRVRFHRFRNGSCSCSDFW